MVDRDTGMGVWVYAVCASIDEASLVPVRGVDGESVRTVGTAGLTAVVGSVDLAIFGEDGLRRGLNDLVRLEAIVRAHHHVIQAISRNRPAVPARIPAVYDNDGRVRAMLREHGHTLANALDRIDGRQEWGVKAYGRRDAELVGPPEPRAESGTAYLQRKRAGLSAQADRRRDVSVGADAVHAQLSESAEAVRLHRPQDPALTSDGRWMVLNGSYLVDEARAEAFRTAATTLAREHPELTLELTGPWPPYSFVGEIEEPAMSDDAPFSAEEPE
jgi:hypothetical protein